MKKLIADIHTHTIVSGHAYGTLRENAQMAAERGLQVLGHSEHAPGIDGTVHETYYINFKAVPRELYGVSIINGCEINVLNDGSLSLKQFFMDRLDYGIAGIHINCYRDEGREKNTQNLISCMKNDKIFFVSHPDDDNTPLDYQEVVKAAARYHVALEVNNSSLREPYRRLNCHENIRTYLDLCMQYRVPIIISSDAHDPLQVGEFSLAEQFVEACGFDEDLILNNDKDKLYDFIGMK